MRYIEFIDPDEIGTIYAVSDDGVTRTQLYFYWQEYWDNPEIEDLFEEYMLELGISIERLEIDDFIYAKLN